MTLSFAGFDLSGPERRDITPFQTVVGDPPWAPRDALPGPKRGARKHYATMSTPDIRALAFRFPAIAADALLWLWRLSSMPYDGLDVCHAWSFVPVSELVWIKVPKATPESLLEELAEAAVGPMRGAAHVAELVRSILADVVRKSFAAARAVRIMLGHYVRLSHETCIIAARPGAASRVLRHDLPSVIFAPVGRHSEKPERFFEVVEAMTPGPYLELFSRKRRNERWTAIGDEIGSSLDLPLAPSPNRI